MAFKGIAGLVLRQRFGNVISKRNPVHIVCFPARTSSPPTIYFKQVRKYVNKSDGAMDDASIPTPRTYHFADIENDFVKSSTTSRVLIDAREPGEILKSGTIPGSLNIPLLSVPDALLMGEIEFENRFGFKRPAKDVEMIFFCHSGIRSLRAANLALEAGWLCVGNYSGSWLDWEGHDGEKQLVTDVSSNSGVKGSIT